MQVRSPIVIADHYLHLTETSLLAAMMKKCDEVYWPANCSWECLGAMKEGVRKERAT